MFKLTVSSLCHSEYGQFIARGPGPYRVRYPRPGRDRTRPGGPSSRRDTGTAGPPPAARPP
eukprot:107119-Hanusia_phi.AAC.1